MTPDALVSGGLPGAAALGLLMAIHPCFLSNTAATALLVSAPASTRSVGLVRGGVLVLGMVSAHLLLAILLSSGLIAVPTLASTLPRILRPFLPPFFILTGILMTGLVPWPSSFGITGWVAARFQGGRIGLAGVFLAGVFLALAFCPSTAGLFFIVLIPAAITGGRPILTVLAFAIGYGALLLALMGLLHLGVRLPALARRAKVFWKGMGFAFIAWGSWGTIRMLG